MGCSNDKGCKPSEDTKEITEANKQDDFSTPIIDDNELYKGEFSGIIYFGRDTCPFCVELNPYLRNAIEENDEIVIYKYDTDIWRDSEHFNEILARYDIESVPVLMNIYSDGTFNVFEGDSSLSNEKILLRLDEFLN